MDVRKLYTTVQQRARLASPAAAAAAVQNVLASLAPLLGEAELSALADRLPRELARPLARAGGRPDELIDRQVFIGRLVNNLDTDYGYDASLGGLDLSAAYADDDAARQVRAVFAALRQELDPTTATKIRARLPAELRDWWDEA